MIFDVAMPLTLFFVTLASAFLNGKAEGKLKANLEEREFATRDAVLLVAAMGVMISIIAFIPSQALTVLFLFSYSSLLFILTYIFSNKRWYLAVLPPATFVLIYIFLRETTLWSLYLVNIYAVIFAILITLYINGVFNWKTTLVFGAVLTVLDIILVLVTGTMISAARETANLGLPVLVYVPIVPLKFANGQLQLMGLGLGDFFFAGLLGIQMWKRFGRRAAIWSIVGMTISFFIFATILINYGPKFFPGTVMIICGWIPVAAWKTIRKNSNLSAASPTTLQEQNKTSL